jgi:cytochrome P450
VLGMAPAFQRDPFAYAREVARHGDLVAVPFPGMQLVYVLRPDLLEQVLVRDARRYRKGRFMSRVEIVFGEGLLLAEGDAWRKQRLRMAPAFSSQAVREQAGAIGPMAVARLEDWKDGEVRDLHADMMGLTLEVVLRLLFGTSASDEDLAAIRAAFHDIAAHFARALELVVSIPLWIPTPANVRFKRARAVLDGVVSRILRERRAQPDPGRDLLGRLLSAADAAGAPLSEAQLQDEVRTLLLAGHETTAVALTTACWMLAGAPESQEWAWEELDALDGPIDISTPLPRVTAILDEAMRLCPPAPVFPREPIEDVTLDGHTIPAGTTLIVPPFLVHRDARWFDAPEEWRPSRWTDTMRAELPRFAYFPFGGGPRICIGAHLATAEARIVLAELLRRFALTPAEGAALTLVPSITMRPTAPVELVIRRR